MIGGSWKSVTSVAASSALAISLLVGSPNALATPTSTDEIVGTQTSELLGAIPPLCVSEPEPETSEPETSESELANTESVSVEPVESASPSPTETPSSEETTENNDSIEERTAQLPEESDPSSSPSSSSSPEPSTPTSEPTPSASPSESPSSSPSASPEATESENTEAREDTVERPSIECPTPVTSVTAIPGNNQVTIEWASDADNTATSFFVVVEGEDRFVEVAAPATSTVVSGLRNGVEYAFAVIAAHIDGSSQPSDRVTATPTTGLDGEVAGLLVSFNPGSSVTNGAEVVPGEQGVDSVDLVAAEEVADNVHVVEFSESLSITEAEIVAQELTSSPEVEWAEPNQFVSSASDVVINDAEFATQQWNLWDAYGVGVAQGADSINSEYTEAQGEGSTVAVIDTGIVEHPDLDGQVVAGYDFVSSPENLAGQRTAGGSEVPFDGDYEDQARFGQVGWDANPADPGDWNQVAPIRDSSWHGTHVAGVIAAQEGNAEGVIGIAPRAKIQPIRALSWRGGLMSDIAAAITWASGGTVEGVGVNPNPSRVINMSFAMQGVCSNSLQAAIDGAFERGSVLIAAAGNANDDVANYAPANCENVISVGATGRDGKRAPYSNYGAGVDVSAPGGNAAGDGGVVSTSNSGTQGATEPAYVGREGTSIAAAHVAAIAARIMGQFPESKPADVQTVIVGRDAVHAFADSSCDSDPMKTCGSGIAQIASISGEAGVQMNLSLGSDLIADGSTVATGSTVTVGTSALLTPGTAQRELRTTLDSATQLTSGSAVAPEGWTVEYSANGGSSWSTSQPTASTVTDIRARATASAGLIDGTSQIYSSETTSTIPSSVFSASTGGDGWDTFFYEDYVFNIFHHSDGTVIDCHYRSNGDRCTGYKATYGGYRASMRSGGWVDSTTGRMYAFTSQTSTNHVGALCVDVSQSSGPVSCGFIRMSPNMINSNSYNFLTESEYVDRRFFGIAYGYNSSTGVSESQLMCYDAALGAVCANTPVSLVGGNYDTESLANVRPLRIGDKIFAKTSSRIYCYVAATMDECSNQANWPVTISASDKTPIAPHTTTTGTLDGICYEDGCFDFTGVSQPTWITPFKLTNFTNQNWAMHAVTGGLGGTRYFWAAEPLTVYCFDYATNAACTGSFPKYFSGYNLIYTTKPDPENPNCIWVNSDAGRISIFDALTGNEGCTNNPVITLQPSQFAPRYACSTINGITEWTELRLVSLSGGGSASSIGLTVRNAAGGVVTGWNNVPVSVGTPLDMTGLATSASGSRPTFSFAFSGVSGTISTAVIALDYKGKGPELCVDTTASTNTPPRVVSLVGTLKETFLAEETFSTTRTFTIGTTTNTLTQTVPSAPLSVSGSGINTTATVTFRAPSSDGNSTITGYQVSSDAGASWTDATIVDNGDGTFSTRVSGLSAGQTYTFQVAAINAIGRGAAGSASIQIQRARTESLTDTPLNRGPVTLEPDTLQGLPLNYTTSTSSVCTVSSNIVTLVTQGTCTLRAQNSGNPSASPPIAAVDVTGSFQVTAPEPELPGAPTGLTVTRQSGQVRLNWTSPTFTGYTSITDYVVQYKSGSSWSIYADGTSTTTTAVVAGLTNGTTYDFRVAAVNSVGTSAYTSSVSGVPATTPGAATSLASSRSGTNATLTWAAPGTTGGSAITDYVVEYKLSSDSSWTTFVDATTSSTGATVTGLTSGASYDFRISAQNAIGSGPYTSTANLSATPGANSVSLAWTQPSFTGGESLSYYIVQVREFGSSTWTDSGATTTSTSRTVTGLTNGILYEFRIAAVTNTSTSSYTSVATETPRTTPSEILDLSVTPGNRQVSMSWTAPANGGSAITDYVVQFKPSGGNWTTFTDGVSTNASASITSLTNGTSFEFRVAAVNIAGQATYSEGVAATPRTTPGSPTGLSRTLGNSQLGLTWLAPSSTGGAVITDYLVEYRVSGSATWLTFADGVSTGLSTTITGLINGTNYEVQVSAVNTAGAGLPSTTVSGTPRTSPGQPRSVTAVKNSADFGLTWLAPLSNGGSALTDYRIEYREVGDTSWTTLTDSVNVLTSLVVTSLDLAIDYEFRIYAINVVGEGAASDTASTIVQAPATSGSAPIANSEPSPVPTTPEVQPIPELSGETEGAVLIDGVLVDISITAQTSSNGEPTTWAVKGPGFSMAFRPEPVGSSGTLSGPSQGLRTIPGSWVDVQGDGYKGASLVKAYLILKTPIARTGFAPFITPRNASVIYLGEVEVLADGSFNIRVVVPESVDPGSYVLQINGLSPEAKTRSVNMALGVEAGSLSDVATRSVSRKAFFKPRSAKFTENGMSKLRTILANIPKDTTNLEIQVTGVSVSMSQLRDNLELAARRAERIVNYLQKHNVEGQYTVSVETSMRFGSADRLTTTAKRTQKPLTTVVVEVGG